MTRHLAYLARSEPTGGSPAGATTLAGVRAAARSSPWTQASTTPVRPDRREARLLGLERSGLPTRRSALRGRGRGRRANRAIRTNGDDRLLGQQRARPVEARRRHVRLGQRRRVPHCGIRSDGGTSRLLGLGRGGMSSIAAGVDVQTTVGAVISTRVGSGPTTLACRGSRIRRLSGIFSAAWVRSTTRARSGPLSGDHRCWGRGEYGVATPTAGEFSSMGAGYAHSCAIRVDGSLTCWGWDGDGQLAPRPTAAMTTLPVARHDFDLPPLARAAGPRRRDGYDIRYRRARWNGDFGARVTWRSGTTATSATFDQPATRIASRFGRTIHLARCPTGLMG